MSSTYREFSYKGRHPIAETAKYLLGLRRQKCRLSPLILMTDPERLGDPLGAAQHMPEGSTIIYRHFGRPDARQTAEALRQITLARQQQFLIGNDPELAIQIGADGMHFRRDPDLVGPRLWRQRCPDWLITMAALKDTEASYKADLSVLDALFVSSIFPSHSPSAGEPIGIERLIHIVNTHPVPIIALGGINTETVLRLRDTGIAGIAGISGIIPD